MKGVAMPKRIRPALTLEDYIERESRNSSTMAIAGMTPQYRLWWAKQLAKQLQQETDNGQDSEPEHTTRG